LWGGGGVGRGSGPDGELSAPGGVGGRRLADSAGGLWVRVQPSDAASSFAVFDGAELRQGNGELAASAGSRFNTSVTWELRGVTVTSPTHAGAPIPDVASEAALEGVTLGRFTSGSRTLLKTPLDGLPTRWR